MRVVSFLPSATEILFALGRGEYLVGRSHECDHPPEALSRPVVMRARKDLATLDSRAIDGYVRASMAKKEELYEVDEEQLRSLEPDLVLTQDLCAVCSVTPGTLEDALGRLPKRPQALILSPTRLEHLFRDTQKVAEAIGDAARGITQASEWKRRLARVKAEPKGSSSPRVLVLDWLDPPILAGLWVPDMVRAAGGTPLGPKPGAPAQRSDWDAVRGLGADLVVLSPCAYSLERTERELSRQATHPLGDLHPERGTWLADEAFFSRPGPRLLEGVELLSDLLQGTGRPRRAYEGRARPAFRSGLSMARFPHRGYA